MGEASIEMLQQATCTQCQNTRMEGRNLLGTQLFCDAKRMDRVRGVQTVPETVYKEGLREEYWVPVHLQGLEHDNLWSYLNSLLCGSLSVTGGL